MNPASYEKIVKAMVAEGIRPELVLCSREGASPAALQAQIFTITACPVCSSMKK